MTVNLYKGDNVNRLHSKVIDTIPYIFLKHRLSATIMKKIEKIIMLIILACLCVLAWASVFVWHNAVTAIVFTVCIIIWLFGLNSENNN